MELNPEIKNEVAEFVSDMEKQFDLNCLMVCNKYRIPFTLNQAPFSLIMLPLSGDSEDIFKKKVEAAAAKYHNSLSSSRNWHCYLTSLYRTDPWFSFFADSKERFPLKDMAAGADLISPVIYGEKHMARLQKEAEEFFGKGTIKFWKKEVVRRQKEKNKKLVAMCRKEAAYCKERRKLLNKYELEELKDFVLFICKKCQEEKMSLVVALDGSGRPIGKALEWYGVGCPVIYLDPRHIRFLDLKNQNNITWVLEVLEKEFPQVYAALVENPEKVFFIDDQTGYGSTGEKLGLLVNLFSKNGESQLKYAVMTPYMGNNTPSWLRRREIQGLEIAPERSLRAIDKPTSQSRRFYNRLKKIVSNWK